MTAVERVFVGLGGNVGDVRSALDSAVDAIAVLPGTAVVARSACYRTAPIDAGGDDYLNAVAELRTSLAPHALLAALQHIEDGAARDRPYHHAPRTLDLDLLLYGQRHIASADLSVPHPRLHQRAFVLVPLLQIAPGLAHALLGPLDEYLPAVADQAITRVS